MIREDDDLTLIVEVGQQFGSHCVGKKCGILCPSLTAVVVEPVQVVLQSVLQSMLQLGLQSVLQPGLQLVLQSMLQPGLQLVVHNPMLFISQNQPSL